MTATSSRSLTASLGSPLGGEPSQSSVSESAGDSAPGKGRCKGCHYSEPANDTVLLRCLNDKFLLGYDVREPPRDAVVVEDEQGWGFRVGPDFGCIHFVPLRRS